MTDAPRVSILLPTLNGARDLARLLPALARQELAGGFELRALDSQSDDGSRALLEQAGAVVTTIARADFRHGDARNRLARDARGEVLVFLSQDALPADERFLAELVGAFEDPLVAGAFSRILPHADDDPLTARTVLAAPEASDVPRTWERALDGIPPFNTVASAIRRAVFATLPFPDVAFAEDQAWAARALAAGHAIRFVPASVVLHAHRYSPGTAFERYRVDAAFHRRVHGARIRPSLASVARGIAYEVREDWRHLARSGGRLSRHLVRSPALRGAQVLGQYFGSRGWNPGGGAEATRRMT
jgi:rhamnosyltransferase